MNGYYWQDSKGNWYYRENLKSNDWSDPFPSFKKAKEDRLKKRENYLKNNRIVLKA
ncbi:hypothetical protein LCGC14_1880210 [marine sediment metagenome]|uniref:Uncharacterized protein n=1 Tax=marine sediment metagenome TaxID=412755 RepID=A0A0F9G2J5_9ZZZZ